jgi:hypothetical protein
MNILIAGRLGRYAERILALQALGHRLVYCTMPAPQQRPDPDDLQDDSIPQFVLTPGNAGATVRRLVDEYDIDVVYSMKNVWDGSLELVVELIHADLGVPIVRHYKEHFCEPSDDERLSLTATAAQIYINQESLDYFRAVYDVPTDTAHILDTDYLPARYLTSDLAPRLRDVDGRPHVVLAGGLSVTGGRNDVRHLCDVLARSRIHVHLYGRKYVGPDPVEGWSVGDDAARAAYEALEATGWVHLHDHIAPPSFSHEFSRYDAGILHVESNGTHEAPFQRMNFPNRLSPYLSAGLALAQQRGGQDAMEALVTTSGAGFVYDNYDELADVLEDRDRIDAMRKVALELRHSYTFEHHAPRLLEILSRHAREGVGR